jgi:hypothetical protein
MRPITAAHSRTISVSIVALVLLAGCAGMSDAQCRSADWYDVGYRDAMFAMQRQEAVYVGSCDKHGAKVDVARYTQGWTEGKYEADRRNKGATY